MFRSWFAVDARRVIAAVAASALVGSASIACAAHTDNAPPLSGGGVPGVDPTREAFTLSVMQDAAVAAGDSLVVRLPWSIVAEAGETPPPPPANPANGAWDMLVPLPSPRFYPGVVYDEAHDRLLTFGGLTVGSQPVNDTWVLPLHGNPAWQPLDIGGTLPSPRYGISMVYDPVGDRVIVFGGSPGVGHGTLNEVWQLSLDGTPQWTQLTPTGVAPTPRYICATIYDPVERAMVIFGGVTNRYIDETWELLLDGPTEWKQLAPATPPPPLAQSTAVYDATRQAMLVFAGWNGNPDAMSNSVYELDLRGSTGWSEMPTRGQSPPRLRDACGVYDPVQDLFVCFGGYIGGRQQPFLNISYTLALSSGEWQILSPTGTTPVRRYAAGALFDARNERFVMFGGGASSKVTINATSALTLSPPQFWSTLNPPANRYASTAFYDKPRERLLLFGGANGIALYNDIWAYSFDTLEWTRLHPTGTPPPPRAYSAGVYDEVNDRIVLVGGLTSLDGAYANDVWAMSLANDLAWTQLQPEGSGPSPRYGHSAVYDPFGQRLLLFGGSPGPGAVSAELWSLSLAATPAWEQLQLPGDAPQARYVHAAVYDPLGQQMVLFGGARSGSYLSDAWTLPLAGDLAWTRLAPSGPPSARGQMAAAFDPARDRLLIFGGFNGSRSNDGNLGDLWALGLHDTPAWTELSPVGDGPMPRRDTASALDPHTGGMLVFGGYDAQPLSDLYGILFLQNPPGGSGPAVTPGGPDATGNGLALLAESASGGTLVARVPEAGVARLRVFSADGRLCLTRTLAGGTANGQAVNLASAGVTRRGMYLARLEQHGHAAVTRVCVIR